MNKVDVIKKQNNPTEGIYSIPSGFKSRLEEYRVSRGFSQAEFAEKAGLSKESYKQIKDNPTLQMMLKVIHTYPDINPAYLLTGEGSMLQSEDCKQTSDTQEDADYWRDRCMNAEREAERLRGIIEGLRMAMGINTAVQDSSSKVVG